MATNPFDQFDAPASATNPFDQFDAPVAPTRTWGQVLADRAMGAGAAGLDMIGSAVNTVNTKTPWDNIPGGATAFRALETGAGLMGAAAGMLPQGVNDRVGAMRQYLAESRAADPESQQPRSEFAQSFANTAGQYADAARSIQSEKEKATQRRMAEVSKEGFLATVAELATNPSALATATDSLIPLLAAGGGAGRLAGGLMGAKAAGQTAVQIGTTSAIEGAGSGEGAYEAVMQAAPDVLAADPVYQRLLDLYEGDDTKARETLGQMARSASTVSGTASAALLQGIGQRLGLNVAEDTLLGRITAGQTGSRTVNAGLGGAKEFVGEATQGAANQLSQNVGTILGGAESDVMAGVGGAAALEGTAGLGSGLIAGALQTPRPVPRTPTEAGSQAAEDALAQARARTAEPPPAPGKPLNPLLDADAIRAQQGQPPLPETLTRRGRDEKYGVDVEMTPDGKGGYLLVETDASGRREKKIEGTGSGIYQGKFVLNEEGEFVSVNTINRAGHEKDTAKRAFQPPTKEQRQAVVDLVAEIAFERSRGNMARAESLESTLADIAMGRVAATPTPVAAPPLGDIPAESTTDLDAAIDAMLAPTTETAPDGRLGTSAPIAAPPVVGSSGLVDATAAAPDPAAGAVGDVAPETGRRPFLTPDDVAREKFTARATEAGLSPEQIAQMTPDTLADDVTGFFDGRLKGVKSGTILRAQEHVEATGEPAFYVDGDIVNLGGLNKATGENMEAANAHYRAMTDILRAELESTGGDIVPLRTGGDEVGAVVVNAPEPAIRAAMTAANAKVRAYAQANGFGDIPHTKADRTDRGVGLHLGLAPIQPGASLSDIIEASSAEIAASKGGTPDVNGSQTERLGPVAPVGPAGSVGGSVATEAQGAGGQDAARLGEAPSAQGDAQGVRAAPQVTPAEAPSAPTVTAPPPSARPAPKGRSTLRAIAKTIGLDLADFKRQGVDPANFRGSKGSMPGLFRKQGGMTLSRFREWAQENEYLPRDPENAPPTVSDDDALDLFYRMFANEEAVALGDVDANLQAKAEQDRKRAEDRLNADPAAAMQRERARAIGNQPAIEALADFDNGLLTAPGLQKRLDDAETYDESAVPFSRTDKPQGIALNTLSRVVRSLFSGWTNAPTVRAVQSVADVPADVRERARLQTAYHGTPHRGIEQTGFSLQKIGTGEGAQAFGWGLYFAGKKGIAEHYRKALTERDAQWTDEMLAQLPEALSRTESAELGALGQKMRRDGNLPEAQMDRWRYLKNISRTYDEAVERLRPKGALYQVEVPEDSDLLDYDKPLSKHTQHVRDALKKAYIARGMPLDENGEPAFFARDPKGQQLYASLGGINGERAASHALFEAGVPGMRYLDATSRDADAIRIRPVNSNGATRYEVNPGWKMPNGQRVFDTQAEAEAWADTFRSFNYVIWDEAAIRDVKPLFSRESEGTPEGFFDPQTETVWLIADAISTPARARWVAYHEVTGHYGIRGVVDRIGKGAGSLRKAFAATRSNPTIDKLARAIAFDRGLSDAEQNVATEEALAELAAAEETGDWQHLADRYNVTVPASMRPGIRGAIDRFVQSIKRLFSIIAEGRTDAFTDADWRELVAGARRYVREGKAAEPASGGEALASRALRMPKDKVGPDARAENFKRWSNNAPLISRADALTHEFKTGQRVVVEAFHGTKRPDRIGKGFSAKRATSGPMSFFTSDPSLASGYAQGKADTSLTYEDQDFAQWFKVRVPGYRNPVSLDRAWFSLPNDVRAKMAELAPRVRTDFETGENIELADEGYTNGIGNYDWEIKQNRGNVLKALMAGWLEGGVLHNEEQRFMDVLELAGMPMDAVTYDSPFSEFPAVFPTFVQMQRPLVTDDIPANVMDALKDAARRDRSRASEYGADSWDKNTKTLRQWFAELIDNESGLSEFAWTQIPDKVTNVLRSLGYDGIIDVGGKGGGEKHRVYVPFNEDQVKGVFNKGTFDRNKPRDLLMSVAPRTPEQTQTAAFARWFGDSKVVDAEGRPLVVYKGMNPVDWETGAPLESINAPGRLYAGFFSSDADVANRFADAYTNFNKRSFREGVDEPVGAAVYPVFVRIERPFVINADGDFAASVQFNDAVSGWSKADLDAALRNGDYDGVILKNTRDEGDVYIPKRPEQIKSAIGNSGAFDPNNPSILKSVAPRRTRAQAEGDAEQRRQQVAGELPVSRGAVGWNYDRSAWVGRKGALKRARAVLQDKMQAWAGVQDQIAQQVGAAIPDAQNVYRMETLMHGRVSEQMDALERGSIEPIMRAIADTGVTVADVEQFMYARHAQERNADIAAKNPAMPDGGSGMTNAEAAAILAGADAKTLAPLADRVKTMIQQTRVRLYKHGLISREQFDALNAQYQHYVPLRGKPDQEFEQGGGGNAGRGIDSRRTPVQEALGRGAGNRAQSILGEVVADAQRAIILAEKARVGRTVMRLVLANPNPSLWTVEPVQTERRQDANGEVYEAVVNDWSDPSIVAVKVGGKLYKVQFTHAPLAQALNMVGVDQLDVATRTAGAFNRYFSAVLTRYNPAFVPVNAARDALFGLTGLAVEHGEAAALDAALHYPQAARAAFRSARGKSGNSPWDAWAKEFAEAGGKTGYVAMPSVEDLQRAITGKGLSKYSANGLTKLGHAVADAIGAANDAVENALRLSAYVTLRKRGVSIEAAAEYAKNLTVNFNRKGYEGSRLNAWFLFYNAAMQGAKRAVDVMRKPKTWAYLGGLAAAQTIAAMAAMGMEDEDGEPLWNKVPDHVKRRNLVIVTPDGGVATIPMPYGFNVFTYLAGRIPTAIMDADKTKASNRAGAIVGDTLSALVESFVPVPVSDGALGLLPTVLRIPVNVAVNKDDFGRAIRTENPYGKHDVPRASMGKPDTPEVFKLAAQGLNRIGGGDEYTPPPMSWFDRAPEDFEYLLGELTGGAGKFVMDVATLGGKLATDAPVMGKDVPIAKRFAHAIDEQAAQQSMFYERRDTISRSLEKVKDTFKRDGEEAATAMMDAMPELKGASFRRRKNDSKNGPAGSVEVRDGRPVIEATDPNGLYALYKATEDAVAARNEAIREAYADAPAGLVLPNAERDRKVREQNTARMEAQRRFNARWVVDVVGVAE